MSVGFIAVVGMEFLYFGILEGNPLYRLAVDFSTHLNADISNLESVVVGMAVNVSKVEGAFVGNLSRTGNLSVNRIIDPIIVVLLNQEFMLFYF